MNEKSYTLSFYEALKQVLECGEAVRGESFQKGCYMTTDSSGKVILKDVNDLKEMPFPLYSGIQDQKFRIVNVWTKKELNY